MNGVKNDVKCGYGLYDYASFTMSTFPIIGKAEP